jgi:uracil-DNA glycosylase
MLGRKQLAGTIGERFQLAQNRVAIPLPHPSGVSLWLNSPENRALVARAVDLVHVELAAIGARS